MTALSTQGEIPLVPPTIVVGGDQLALSVCEIIAGFDERRPVLLWTADGSLQRRAARANVPMIEGDATENEALERAGIREAKAIMLMADDDHFNLEAAMRARDLNPNVRIVMRQFNRELGRKIESNLENSAVVSLASQSAATFASVAVDAACFYGVQFPDIDGPLFGFRRCTAREANVANLTIAEAQTRSERRIVAVGGILVSECDPATPIGEDAEIVSVAPARPLGRRWLRSPAVNPRVLAHVVKWALRRLDPLAVRLAIVTALVFASAAVYFAHALNLSPSNAAYFVTTMMTTTGFGDIVPSNGDAPQHVAAMFVMAAGVTLTGLFVALFTSYFTAAQYHLLQGLRRVDASGHIVVCGAGKVGSRVIEFLVDLGREVIVVERNPSAALIDLARRRKVSLMTADATADQTLELCNLGEAVAVLALTENDTVNLEVGLGARRFNATIPAVLRVAENDFARSITRHFGLRRTYSTAALAAPVFVGLASSEHARGFFKIGEREFGVGQIRKTGGIDDIERVEGSIALARWRDGRAEMIAGFDEAREGDRVLYLYPAYRFRRRDPA